MPRRILVVEDEAMVAKVTSQSCQQAGYQCSWVGRGAEALQRVDADGPVDLFIIDVRLPDMRGTELARQVVVRYPDTKVIFISAYPEHQHTPPDPVLGVFLPKPYSPDELLVVVSQLLPD